MIDYSNCKLLKVALHQVGNKTNEEQLQCSDNLLDIADPNLQELLFRFFLSPFSTPEFYSFNTEAEHHVVYPLTLNLFDQQDVFHEYSIEIAKYLYDLAIHPQIKSGDLFIAYLADIIIEDELTDAVGIFKSEHRQEFLKLGGNGTEFSLLYEDGINVDKLDKGCLILNTNRKDGFKICVVDKSNKSQEAQYWKDDFLNLRPFKNDYHHTKAFMNITKNFVTKQLTEEFEVSKADQIDLLNRSVDYFKANETFDKQDFENQVLQNEAVISSFRTFNDNYRQENQIELDDNFDISPQAVKNQSRVFKSVLKLDKNFHIYIHGNRELIEQGVDQDGRKFYKIYFDREA